MTAASSFCAPRAASSSSSSPAEKEGRPVEAKAAEDGSLDEIPHRAVATRQVGVAAEAPPPPPPSQRADGCAFEATFSIIFEKFNEDAQKCNCANLSAPICPSPEKALIFCKVLQSRPCLKGRRRIFVLARWNE